MRNYIMGLRPQRLPFRRFTQRSAVAIITRQGTHGEEILFIKRATRPGDPWSGDIAFPGGKQQQNDNSIRDTAIRETKEEINIDLAQQGIFISRQIDVLTRRHNKLAPMVVTPYHYQLNSSSATNNDASHPALNIRLNHEVAEVIWVPTTHFHIAKNTHHFRWTPAPHSIASRLSISLPCYYYDNHRIWGLTYQMLRDFITHREINNA